MHVRGVEEAASLDPGDRRGGIEDWGWRLGDQVREGGGNGLEFEAHRGGIQDLSCK